VSALAIILTAAAYVASTISGFIGMAGGALLLGIMLIAGLEPAVAIPLHAVVQLVSNATRSYAHLPHVRWRMFLLFAIPAIPGPIVGLWLLERLEGDAITIILACLILYAAWAPKWGLHSLPTRWAFILAGTLAGMLGVVLGATGPLIAPFFLREGLNKEAIIATKAICQVHIHVIKIVAFGAVGFQFAEHWTLLAPMAVAVVAGTYTGKLILGRLSEKWFRWIYKIVLTALALRMLFESAL
jgi:uncharacterized membrane protein YfcA